MPTGPYPTSRAKTSRVIARIRAAELAEKLQVERSVIYTQMHQLHIKPRYGFGKQIYFSPAQAKLITEKIKRDVSSSSTTDLSAERARLLIKALEDGSTIIQLVIVHGASPAESDAAWTWWHHRRKTMVLTEEEIELLQTRVGKFEAGGHLASLIDEAIFAAKTCENCGSGIERPLCRNCSRIRKPAGPPVGGSIETNRIETVLDDRDPDFEEKMRKAEEQLTAEEDSTATQMRQVRTQDRVEKPAPMPPPGSEPK